jgi:hypothetical protein
MVMRRACAVLLRKNECIKQYDECRRRRRSGDHRIYETRQLVAQGNYLVLFIVAHDNPTDLKLVP